MAELLWFHYDIASHSRGRAGTPAEGLCRRLSRSHTPHTSVSHLRTPQPVLGSASAGSPAHPCPLRGKGFPCPGRRACGLWGRRQCGSPEGLRAPWGRDACLLGGLSHRELDGGAGPCLTAFSASARCGRPFLGDQSSGVLVGVRRSKGTRGAGWLLGQVGQTAARPAAHRAAFALGGWAGALQGVCP